jgi:hypothetical protein
MGQGLGLGLGELEGGATRPTYPQHEVEGQGCVLQRKRVGAGLGQVADQQQRSMAHRRVAVVQRALDMGRQCGQLRAAGAHVRQGQQRAAPDTGPAVWRV